MAEKTVWISGASSGLGKAAAKALLADGWQVVSGARSFKGNEETGEFGRTLPLDVRSEQSVSAFCEKALSLYGVPDALVNAAGILREPFPRFLVVVAIAKFSRYIVLAVIVLRWL